MGIEITGHVRTVFETKQVSERFTKREFVVELSDNPKFPQLVLFQMTGDRCSQLDDIREGDKVRIDFSLRGREWRSPKGEVKYFNSLDAWSVEIDGPPPPRGGGRRPANDDPAWVRGDGPPPSGDDDRY